MILDHHIWPVGYRSSWHDKVSRSLFVCDVVDGGSSGPIFKLRRCPCSASVIPDASIVLLRQILGKSEAESKSRKWNGHFSDLSDTEDIDIQCFFPILVHRSNIFYHVLQSVPLVNLTVLQKIDPTSQLLSPKIWWTLL
ncbi:hypothetical protein MKW92_039305 [Papaver armeniacum]|nr:hypothetical protein MKW92_039305 [Papaver armeniacum]